MSSPSTYYFAQHRSTSNPNAKEIDLLSPHQEKKLQKATSPKNTNTAEEVHEHFPKNSNPEEFYARPVWHHLRTNSTKSILTQEEQFESHQTKMIIPGLKDPPIGSLVLERKVPVKLDPKGMFAVERTFLLWMHSALWLLTAAIGILSYTTKNYDDSPYNMWYAVSILPIAVLFILYALFMYVKRVRMLRQKLPGPYEDLRGPTVLAVMLMMSIVVQFGLKLYQVLDVDGSLENGNNIAFNWVKNHVPILQGSE